MTLLVLLFSLLWGAHSQETPPPKEVSLGEKFTLRAGQEAVIRDTDLRLRFSRVVQDSRCPIGVQCVWQGNGQIHLSWERSQARPIWLLLNTGLSPKDFSCGGLGVDLVDLQPPARPNIEIDPAEYQVVLVVRRAETEAQ